MNRNTVRIWEGACTKGSFSSNNQASYTNNYDDSIYNWLYNANQELWVLRDYADGASILRYLKDHKICGEALILTAICSKAGVRGPVSIYDIKDVTNIKRDVDILFPSYEIFASTVYDMLDASFIAPENIKSFITQNIIAPNNITLEVAFDDRSTYTCSLLVTCTQDTIRSYKRGDKEFHSSFNDILSNFQQILLDPNNEVTVSLYINDAVYFVDVSKYNNGYEVIADLQNII